MTRLLVSVRSVEEARIALAAGVDLIDLKEPLHGSLGRVEHAVANDVARLVAGENAEHLEPGTPYSVLRTRSPDRIPLSMALGELLDPYAAADNATVTNVPPRPADIDYFKIGLAGCARQSNWPEQLRQFASNLPPSAGLVAVVYADAELCAAPPAGKIVAVAAALGAKAVLVDTAVKNGRGLFDWWSEAKLTSFAADVRKRGMFCVAGGALTIDTIPTVTRCHVDYAAVRGAACNDSRTGTLDADRIRSIRAAIAATGERRGVSPTCDRYADADIHLSSTSASTSG